MTIAPGTTAFYDRWAVTGEEAARSAMSRHFESAFEPGARVLDVGCGKGRDVVALLDMGFEAYGVEPNEAMRSHAIARDPRLPGRIEDAALPALGQPFGGGFDAVACSAVLMHLPAAALPASLAALAAVLRPRGRVLMAVPEMLPELLVDGHDPDGRAFANHSPEHVRSLMEQFGFALRMRDDIRTPSTDTRWRVLLFERQARRAGGAWRRYPARPASGSSIRIDALARRHLASESRRAGHLRHRPDVPRWRFRCSNR